MYNFGLKTLNPLDSVVIFIVKFLQTYKISLFLKRKSFIIFEVANFCLDLAIVKKNMGW